MLRTFTRGVTSVRNLAVRHTRCRLLTCDADWLEAIALNWTRARCEHCKRLI